MGEGVEAVGRILDVRPLQVFSQDSVKMHLDREDDALSVLCPPPRRAYARVVVSPGLRLFASAWSALPRSQGDPPQVSSPSVSTTITPGLAR